MLGSRRDFLRATLALVSIGLAFVTPPPTAGQTLAQGGVLRVTGMVQRPLALRDSDLQGLPRKHLAVTDEKGKPVTYDGVAVADILLRAGAPLGRRLRGQQMRCYVVVDAEDGYRVVYALPEFDPDFTDKVVIVADRRDGHALGPGEGPFRLVAPDDKRHARWVREVTVLDVEQVR